MEIDGENGEKITVYTVDEVAAREEAAKATISTELTAKLTEAQTEKERLEVLLKEKAGDFGRFRTKLTAEQEEKLSTSDREKYDIQMQLKEATEAIATLKGAAQQSKIDAVISAQCGGDENLIEKTKVMYGKIDLPVTTPEEIAARVRAAFGAIAPSEPNVASFLARSGGNGSYQPPQPQNAADAPSDRTKKGAAELGLKI